MTALKYEFDGGRQISATRLLLPAVILTVFIVVFSTEVYVFARAQDIWGDEATQLFGSTLSPRGMVRWLTGYDVGALGVAADRMPPVSYFLDWLWLRLAGPSVLGFRLFHSAFVIAGILTLTIAAWREKGIWAATLVLVFSMLSPNLIATAVEIRAYPLFFAVTCAQIYVFVRIVENNDRANIGLVIIFVFLSLISVYTHFYGLVSSCSLFVTLVVVFLRSKSSALLLVSASTSMLIASIGIIPFAIGAVNISGRIDEPLAISPYKNAEAVSPNFFHSLSALSSYFFSLLGSDANMVSVLGYALFVIGMVALILVSAIIPFVYLQRRAPRPFDWLCLTVVIGVSVPLFTNILVKLLNIKIFDVTSGKYSGWLFAPLVLIIASGAVSSTGFRPWDRGGRFAAVAAMFTGAAFGTYMFYAHTSVFVHGPQRFVAAIYDRLPGSKAIVYKDGDRWWFFSYFPLVLTHNAKIAQYRAVDNGNGLIRVAGVGNEAGVQAAETAVAPYDKLLVVDVQLRNYLDMRACISETTSCPGFAQGSIEALLTGTGRWRETMEQRGFGEYDTQVRLLERVGERPTP